MKRFALALCLPLLFAGCLSPSPDVHFYVLPSPEPAVPAALSLPAGPRVGVLPVNLPDYLRHSQMILRHEGDPAIIVDDYNRWGEDLSDGIARVLGEAITNRLADVRGVALPQRAGVPVDLRVHVEIRRFEGTPGGKVWLDALWGVQRGGKPVLGGHYALDADAGNSVADMVNALSGLIDALGADIAAGVRTVAAGAAAPAPPARRGSGG